MPRRVPLAAFVRLAHIARDAENVAHAEIPHGSPQRVRAIHGQDVAVAQSANHVSLRLQEDAQLRVRGRATSERAPRRASKLRVERDEHQVPASLRPVRHEHEIHAVVLLVRVLDAAEAVRRPEVARELIAELLALAAQELDEVQRSFVRALAVHRKRRVRRGSQHVRRRGRRCIRRKLAEILRLRRERFPVEILAVLRLILRLVPRELVVRDVPVGTHAADVTEIDVALVEHGRDEDVLQLLRQAHELREQRVLRIHRGFPGSIQYRLRFGDHVAVGRDSPGVHGGERQGAQQVERAVREPTAVVHLARVHGVRERTDPGFDDFQRRVPDSLRIPQLVEKNASVFLGGAQPLRDGGDLLVHPFLVRSLPALGGIEARRVRRRNAPAVHLQALRQNELGGIARSVAGVRDRGGGIARFGAARVRETADAENWVREKNERHPRTLKKNAGKREKTRSRGVARLTRRAFRAWAGSSQRRLYPSPRSGPRRSCASGALVRLR